MTALCIGIPFFRDDPCDLIRMLAREPAGAACHLIVVDDGTGTANLSERVADAVASFPGRGDLITLPHNQGRSAARNALIEACCSSHILFLDADMAPDPADFLARWQLLIAQDNPAIAFGGFSTKQVHQTRANALSYYLARTSDCPPLADRAAKGALSVATSNLLVRRDVLDVVPFDAGFVGWGWEDVEWALRASAHFPVIHVDIPATHMGLDDAATLLRKYERAGPNLKRLVEAHAEAASLPGVKIAKALAPWPHKALRPLLASLAQDRLNAVPTPLRAVAAKLWRASWAAEALA